MEATQEFSRKLFKELIADEEETKKNILHRKTGVKVFQYFIFLYFSFCT